MNRRQLLLGSAASIAAGAVANVVPAQAVLDFTPVDVVRWVKPPVFDVTPAYKEVTARFVQYGTTVIIDDFPKPITMERYETLVDHLRERAMSAAPISAKV